MFLITNFQLQTFVLTKIFSKIIFCENSKIQKLSVFTKVDKFLVKSVTLAPRNLKKVQFCWRSKGFQEKWTILQVFSHQEVEPWFSFQKKVELSPPPSRNEPHTIILIYTLCVSSRDVPITLPRGSLVSDFFARGRGRVAEFWSEGEGLQLQNFRERSTP